jgi:hypothetical protein
MDHLAWAALITAAGAFIDLPIPVTTRLTLGSTIPIYTLVEYRTLARRWMGVQHGQTPPQQHGEGAASTWAVQLPGAASVQAASRWLGAAASAWGVPPDLLRPEFLERAVLVMLVCSLVNVLAQMLLNGQKIVMRREARNNHASALLGEGAEGAAGDQASSWADRHRQQGWWGPGQAGAAMAASAATSGSAWLAPAHGRLGALGVLHRTAASLGKVSGALEWWTNNSTLASYLFAPLPCNDAQLESEVRVRPSWGLARRCCRILHCPCLLDRYS